MKKNEEIEILKSKNIYMARQIIELKRTIMKYHNLCNKYKILIEFLVCENEKLKENKCKDQENFIEKMKQKS